MLGAMDERQLGRRLRTQDGVVSRHQVLDSGGDDQFIERQLRRREWARVHEGVYVNHTGPLTRRQREWAAVLVHQPCALAGRSALRAHGLDPAASDGSSRKPDDVELAVDRSRRVADPPGVRTIQLRRFADLAQLDASPPRLRVEPAALLLASRARTNDAAVAVLADVVRAGRTTSARLADELDSFPRLPRRALLGEVVADVGIGAHSPLEIRYLRDVERAHGLPRGERQVREATQVVEGEVIRVVHRDVRYRRQRALVELDGVLGHAAAVDRWNDLDRDLDAAVQGSITLRVGWQQVLQPCRLAVVLGAILVSRGWTDQPAPCGRDCVLRPARIA
jgi:hypothetical protein